MLWTGEVSDHSLPERRGPPAESPFSERSRRNAPRSRYAEIPVGLPGEKPLSFSSGAVIITAQWEWNHGSEAFRLLWGRKAFLQLTRRDHDEWKVTFCVIAVKIAPNFVIAVKRALFVSSRGAKRRGDLLTHTVSCHRDCHALRARNDTMVAFLLT